MIKFELPYGQDGQFLARPRWPTMLSRMLEMKNKSVGSMEILQKLPAKVEDVTWSTRWHRNYLETWMFIQRESRQYLVEN
jgi:hypothetical protein